MTDTFEAPRLNPLLLQALKDEGYKAPTPIQAQAIPAVMEGRDLLGIAHKGLVHVAKIMAGTAVDAIANPEILAAAKADHEKRMAVTPYVCPLPPDVEPPIQMSA